MFNQTNTKIKIILVLAAAFLLGSFVSNSIFVASTPIVRSDVMTRLKNLPKDLLNSTKNTIAFMSSLGRSTEQNRQQISAQNQVYTNFIKNEPNVTPPPQVPFKAISKGVYAADDPQTNTRYLKLDSGTKLQEKTIKIRNSDGTVQELKALVPVSQ